MQRFIVTLMVFLFLVPFAFSQDQAPAQDEPSVQGEAPVQDEVSAQDEASAQIETPAQDDPAGQDGVPVVGVSIEEMVICEDVVDRTPVNPSEFIKADGVAVCFTKIFTNEPISIEHVWYHENEELDRISLQANPPSWRTWSRKTLHGMTGVWRVEVVDATGAVLRTTHFQAE